MIPTHMFWHGGSLSPLERLAITSFVTQGFDLTVWTYGDIPNLPNGARLADASIILPASALFLNQRGSYASFSDWFRYSLLSRFGGLYADTDVIALKPASDLPPEKFLVSQWQWSKRRFRPRTWRIAITNNLIHNPNPAKGDLIDLACAYAERFPKAAIDWSEIGPDLIEAITRIHPTHFYRIMPPGFANPIGYWQSPQALLRPGELRPNAFFLHCYNEMWRRAGIDKTAPFPPGSLIADIAARFV